MLKVGEVGSLCIELDAADGAVGQRSVPACFLPYWVVFGNHHRQSVTRTQMSCLLHRKTLVCSCLLP